MRHSCLKLQSPTSLYLSNNYQFFAERKSKDINSSKVDSKAISFDNTFIQLLDYLLKQHRGAQRYDLYANDTQNMQICKYHDKRTADFIIKLEKNKDDLIILQAISAQQELRLKKLDNVIVKLLLYSNKMI